MLRAGDLRHRVTIQSLTPTSDSQGGRSTAPATVVADLPCAVDVLTRNERVAAGQLTSTSTHRLRMRVRADVSVTHRAVVTYGDTGSSVTFQIEAVERGDDRGRETHVYCAVVQA